MNKAKSLRFPPQSELSRLRHTGRATVFLEQVEMLFWHSFIHLVSSLRESRKNEITWQSSKRKENNPFRWQGYLLFSAISLLCGVLLGFLFGHLF